MVLSRDNSGFSLDREIFPEKHSEIIVTLIYLFSYNIWGIPSTDKHSPKLMFMEMI
jgi:hypothetical protein